MSTVPIDPQRRRLTVSQVGADQVAALSAAAADPTSEDHCAPPAFSCMLFWLLEGSVMFAGVGCCWPERALRVLGGSKHCYPRLKPKPVPPHKP
eukprot:1004937-Amphidinium_carterae.1